MSTESLIEIHRVVSQVDNLPDDFCAALEKAYCDNPSRFSKLNPGIIKTLLLIGQNLTPEEFVNTLEEYNS